MKDVPPPTAPLAQPALYQQVAERLRALIYAHHLKPGDWLDEQRLAAKFGISRTPLREALKVLASEGLVTLLPRRGCKVAALEEGELDDIFAVLAELEGMACCLAANRSTAEDLERLAALHAELERHASAQQTDRFFEANQAFHTQVQKLSGNRWLAQLIADSRRRLMLTRRTSLDQQGRIAQSLHEHRNILAALMARDAPRAGQLMREHILSGRAALAALAHEDPAR